MPASGTPSISRLEDDTPAEPVVTDLLGIERPLYGLRNIASRDVSASSELENEAQAGPQNLGEEHNVSHTGPSAHAGVEDGGKVGMELGGRVIREQETAGKTEHLPSGEPQSGGRDQGPLAQVRPGVIDPFAEPPIVIDGEELVVREYRDIAPAAWPSAVRANYHMVEVQALLGGPVTDDVRDAVRALGESSKQGFLIGIVRGMFSGGPRPGMDSVAFRTKRLQGRESYPTWGELEPSCTDSAQVKQARAIRSALLDSGIETGSLLFRTGELLTPGQYKALGLRSAVPASRWGWQPVRDGSSRAEGE